MLNSLASRIELSFCIRLGVTTTTYCVRWQRWLTGAWRHERETFSSTSTPNAPWYVLAKESMSLCWSEWEHEESHWKLWATSSAGNTMFPNGNIATQSIRLRSTKSTWEQQEASLMALEHEGETMGGESMGSQTHQTSIGTLCPIQNGQLNFCWLSHFLKISNLTQHYFICM